MAINGFIEINISVTSGTRRVCVNTQQIERVLEKDDNGCYLKTTMGDMLVVGKSYDEVVAAITEANKNTPIIIYNNN